MEKRELVFVEGPFDKIEIAVDTPVWVRNSPQDEWHYMFLSHITNNGIYCFVGQCNSKQATNTYRWNQCSFENPFEL